jgi:plasmid segregation protein ParM
MGMQEERSGSVPAGMSLILDKLCELISQDLSYTFTRINLIDEGIRNNFRMKIQGEIYDFSHLIPKIDDHILASIQSISRSVGNVDDIDNVLLVGGGAKCYQSIIERLIKHRNIVIRDNSIYSNVKGFYIAGRERAASQNKMGV